MLIETKRELKSLEYCYIRYIYTKTNNIHFNEIKRRKTNKRIILHRGMAEESPSSIEEFYTKAPDRSIQNVTNGPTVNPINPYHVYDQRRVEHENLTQKSLPNLKKSYGTIFQAKSFHGDSAPLINTHNYHRCQPYLCAEPVRLTRYRRNQIFLFFYIVFYVGYLMIGSICFQKLETGMEQRIRDEFRADKQKFLEDYPNVKGHFLFVHSFFFSLFFFRCQANHCLVCFHLISFLI